MKLCFLKVWLLFVFLNVALSDEEVENEDDIPVVEGFGGVITTTVEDDVLILTRQNFDLQISNKDIILVEFYAPWCGHCKSLAPEYAKAAKILKDEDPPIPLAKVDATIETELASQYDVTGYPTLFVFKKGEKIPYDGPRTALGIVEYMKQRSDPNWKPPPQAVLMLTNENFTEVIEKADIILVEFYAPWCGHCKRLAPEYERAAKVLKEFSIPLGKIDGTAEKKLADKYEAKGWPTLMIFRRGKKYEYEGPRDESGIISYMKQQAKPPSKEIKSVKEIEKSLEKTDCTVVGFFSAETDPLYDSFKEAGNILRGKFTFLHSFSNNLMKQYRLENPSVVMLQPEIYATDFEPPMLILNNPDASAHEVTTFIKENFLPLVGERTQSSRWKYENKYPLVVIYYDVDFSFDHRVQTQLIRKEVAKVAKDYKGQVTFAVSKEGDYEDELIQLNLGDSGEDVNVGFFQSASVRFRMEPAEDFSAEVLKEFVEDVIAGKVRRQIRSQPAPKENAGPVLTVVGSTFEELVLRGDRDVLVQFHAPWCGHCKKLEPVYRRLARSLAGHGKVTVAKMDATANDYPAEFAVGGFPALYYVRAGNGGVVRYDGDRSFDDLTKFVREQLGAAAAAAKDEL